MRGRWKSRICRFLAGVTFMIMLVSCSNDLENNETFQGELANPKESNFNATGLPVFKSPVKYRVITSHPPSAKKYYTEKDLYKKRSQETNVIIEWEEVPSAVITEKLNLVVNSGNYPDAIYAGGLAGIEFASAIEAGVFLPMNDYLPYAPNLRKLFQVYPRVKETATYLGDGKIYRYPGVGIKSYAALRSALLINKKWLDNLGLQVPKTTQEYYNVLKAFKDKDANGNGDNNDEIPASFAQLQWWGLGYEFLEAFLPSWGLQGIRNGSIGLTGEMTIRNGKLYFHPVEDAWRDALTFIHTLYNEGLMDKESLIQQSKDVTSKTASSVPMIGSYLGWSLPVRNAEQYVALEPLTGPRRDKYAIWNQGEFNVYNGLQIFSSCKQPEGLIRWCDHLNDGTNAIENAYGPEGIAWTKNEATKTWSFNVGKLRELGISDEEFRQSEATQNGPEMSHIKEITGYTYVDVPGSTESYKQQWSDMARPYFFKENWSGETPLEKTTKEDEEVQFIWIDLKEYLKIFVANAVIDGIDDAKWNKHIADCKRLKYEQLVAYMQKKYDKFK